MAGWSVRAWGLAVVVPLLLAGCGPLPTPDTSLAFPAGGAESGLPVPSASAIHTDFDGVTLTPKAVVIDEAAVRAGLKSVTGTRYRFAAGTPGVPKLAVGSVMLLAGRALRAVTAVTQEAGDVVVDTESTALNELIDSGTVAWQAPVDWASLPPGVLNTVALRRGLTGRLLGAALRAGPRVPDRTPLATVGGFEVSLALTPKADRLEFELSAKRSNVKLTAKGYISNFIQSATLRYSHGAAQLARADVRGIKAEAEVTWAAVGVGSAGLDTSVVRFAVPVEVPIPIDVGGIPFVLTIKAALRVVPVLRKDSSSGGSFKVSYDSDQGFSSAAQGGPVAVAALRSASGVLGSTATVTAGFLPVGFAWGWEFPRLELSVAGTGTFAALTFDTYAAGEWTPGTTLTADIPPCQRASVTLNAFALFQLKVLGIVAISGQKTLWTRTFEKYKDNKPCSLTGPAPGSSTGSTG